MRKLIFIFIILIVSGATAFPHSTNDDDYPLNIVPFDALFGLEWSTGMENDNLTKGLTASIFTRMYLNRNKLFSLGFSVSAKINFIREMEFKMPENYTGGSIGPAPGETITITSHDADKLLYYSLLPGICLRGNFPGSFGFVIDLWLAFDYCKASWDTVIQPWTLFGPPEKSLFLELSNIYLGFTLNLGLQYKINLGLMYILMEAGVNASYIYCRWNTVDLYVADPHNKDDKTDRVTATGNFEPTKIFRIGTPYFAVGLRF